MERQFESRFRAQLDGQSVEVDPRLGHKRGANGQTIFMVAVRAGADSPHRLVSLSRLENIPQGRAATSRQYLKDFWAPQSQPQEARG